MVCRWFAYGLPMVYQWFTDGLPMVYRNSAFAKYSLICKISTQNLNRTDMITQENFIFRDITNLSQWASDTLEEIGTRAREVKQNVVLSKHIEAIKLSIEIEYLEAKLSELLRRIAHRANQEPQEYKTAREYFDCHIPNDFWEQEDNRKKLERQTALTLQSGKLQYQ